MHARNCCTHSGPKLNWRYLLTDAEVGHTLLDAAETTTVSEERERRIQQAHKAYRSILHLLSNLTPDKEQQAELDLTLTSLRERLIAFGVCLDIIQTGLNGEL